jgi:PKD repeat protein
MRLRTLSLVVLGIVIAGLLPMTDVRGQQQGGDLSQVSPLFPRTNWWNLNISSAPVDSNSNTFIQFIGPTRGLHPDFGGEVFPGSVGIYGFPYIVVNGSQPKKAVTFQYSDESDGVNHSTNQSFPFYPIPDEAIRQSHWIEGGEPGQDPQASGDRHMLIVDRDNKHLYELYSVFYNGTSWQAGSGAFFDLNTNGRRPQGWTSADAAGLAILPGLVRADEVFGPDEIRHAFRVTVRSTNGYVYPASHRAGSTVGALPMGARLRLKANVDLSPFPAAVQKIFRAMKTYGVIVTDNGSDMYISGTHDPRWNNDILNPAFRALTANNFEVIQLGYRGSSEPTAAASATPSSGSSPLLVMFDGTASSAPSGRLVAYTWDFGDGISGSGASVSHNYTTAGTFTARLTVADETGATASASVTILVNTQLSISMSGTGMGTVTSADGKISCGPACTQAYVLNTAVTLTPTAAAGSTFLGWSEAGCGNVVVMTTDRRCTAIFNHIVATKPPIAVISATPLLGVSPLTVKLDGSASSDADGRIVAHAWNFGDGTVGSGASVGHVYSKPGSFTATLTVTDDHSAVSSASVTIKVTPPEALRITRQPADRSIRVGSRATFTVTASGTGRLRYQWQKNGVDIAGATFRSYSTPRAVVSDNGSTFQCVVTDGQHTVTSHSATLTVRVRR